MTPEDPRHGEERGYFAHRRAGQKPCDACTQGHSIAQKQRLMKVLNGGANWVPALGTQRRIQALCAIGWRLSDIAAAAGYGRSHEGLTTILYRQTMTRPRTAERIARIYEELSGTPGPSSRVRMNAERRSWAPPLAWDDIDDPDERPTIGAPEAKAANGGRSVALTIEDAEWMADGNATLTEVVERLNFNRDTFRETCSRAGRSDLYWRLARREPDGDFRWETSQGMRRAKEAS